MANVGPLELGVVLIIVLVVFGPKRLPELGQSLGRGMREFKSSLSGETEEETPVEEPRAIESGESAEPVQGDVVSHGATTESKP
jgi:sec-independent protein translocase protein TatA